MDFSTNAPSSSTIRSCGTRSSAHDLDRGRRIEPAREHRQSRPQQLLCLVEQAVAPSDGGLEGLLASFSPPVPVPEDGQRTGQALVELVEAQCAQADGRQLECQGDPIEMATEA